MHPPPHQPTTPSDESLRFLTRSENLGKLKNSTVWEPEMDVLYRSINISAWSVYIRRGSTSRVDAMQDDSIHLCGFVYSGMKEPYIVYSRTPSCCCCRQPAGRQIQADPSGFYTSLSASCGFLLENQISPIEGRENVIVGDTSAPVFLSIFFYPLYVFLFFFQPFLSFFFFSSPSWSTSRRRHTHFVFCQWAAG
jgi:hypothetical protein